MTNTATNTAPAVDNVVATDSAADYVATALEAAIYSVTVGTAVSERASATLLYVTREAYARHAAAYTRDVDGVAVLPESAKADVLAALWGEAGYPVAPPAKERDRGTRTFAQYVSRLAKVATHFDHGVTAVADDAAFEYANDAIKAESEDRSAAKAVNAAAVAHAAFIEWRDSLPSSDREALDKVAKLFTNTSVGVSHAPVFITMITPAK